MLFIYPTLNRLAGATLTLATFIFIAFMFTACGEKIKPSISSIQMGQDIPSQESWNATITFTDSGRVSGILKAGYISSFADKKYTLLDSSITVDFFDEQERHTSLLTAKRGRVNDVTHDFEAYEDVVVISDSGTTLKTEELYWSNKTQKVHTESYVEIISPTEQIQGHGLESNQSLKNYKIFRVTGKAKVQE